MTTEISTGELLSTGTFRRTPRSLYNISSGSGTDLYSEMNLKGILLSTIIPGVSILLMIIAGLVLYKRKVKNTNKPPSPVFYHEIDESQIDNTDYTKEKDNSDEQNEYTTGKGVDSQTKMREKETKAKENENSFEGDESYMTPRMSINIKTTEMPGDTYLTILP